MSATDETSHLNGILSTFERNVGRSFTIGQDQDLDTHHYYQAADMVVVYNSEDGVTHREQLDGRTVDEWVGYVDETRGWLKMGQLSAVGRRADRETKTHTPGEE